MLRSAKIRPLDGEANLDFSSGDWNIPNDFLRLDIWYPEVSTNS
jgi:hypothetical protein